MVTIFGMSELGPIKLGEREEMIFLGRDMSHRNNSEKIASQIDEQIAKIINVAWIQAQQILKKHMKTLNLMADELMKQETLEDQELIRIFGKLKRAEA